MAVLVRRWMPPVALLVLGAGGLGLLASRLAATGRAVAEREAREGLRIRAEAAAAALRAMAQELLRRAATGTPDARLDGDGAVVDPPAPVPLARPATLRGVDPESRFLLGAGEDAERSGDAAEALRFYGAAAESAREPDSRVEAWIRIAALRRRDGDASGAVEAETALREVASPEDSRHRFELLLARARRGGDGTLEEDLLLRVDTVDEPVAAGLLREAGLDAVAAMERRRRSLARRRRAAVAATRRDRAAEGAAEVEGFVVAWTPRDGDVALAEAPVPPAPQGVEIRTGAAPPPATEDLHEQVVAGSPLLDVVVHAWEPRIRVEEAAARGAGLPAAALGLLLLGGGGAALLAVRAAREEARAARERADFVTRVGHDLRTPLALVRMYAGTLAAGRVVDPGEQRSFAAVVERESERLTGMVERIMDLSRGGAPAAGERTSLDLAALVAEVAEAHRPLFEREGASLRVAVTGPLPVRGDGAALRGALGNLLANALRHGGDGRTEVRAARDGDDVRVEVADAGPGIPAGWEERVFERFVRGPGARGAGTGLGLALVRETARAHGGDAVVEAVPAGGARLVLRLPLERGAGASAEEGAA